MAKNNGSSLIILKPDLISQGLERYLKNELSNAELAIQNATNIKFNLETVRLFYGWNVVNFPIQVDSYLCVKPLPVWLVHGVDAIVKVLAIKKSMRHRFPTDVLHNLLHCSDSHEDFLRELKFINTYMEKPMKTNNQVEVIVFRRHPSEALQFLMLKRNERKGGFWQPVTGNVEIDERFEDAAIREALEEVGIINSVRIVDTGYSFDFFDDGRDQHEHVFGIEVSPETDVTLSDEHTEYAWASEDECLSRYLKYPGNKEGLRRLATILVPK